MRHSRVFRQTFFGGNYGLLTSDFQPTPVSTIIFPLVKGLQWNPVSLELHAVSTLQVCSYLKGFHLVFPGRCITHLFLSRQLTNQIAKRAVMNSTIQDQ